MVDNYLERFHKRSDNTAEGRSSTGTDWIAKSINQVPIHKYEVELTTGESIIVPQMLRAVHIFKDKEGPDNGILYTYAKDGLTCGDMIVKNTEQVEVIALVPKQVFMLYEEISRVDEGKDIKVFSTIEINVLVKVNSKVYLGGYFVGRMKKLIGIDYDEKLSFASADQKGLLILSQAYKLITLDTIQGIKQLNHNLFPQYAWQVQDIDSISTKDIQYVTVEKILSTPDVAEPEEQLGPVLLAGQDFVVETEGGYIETQPAAKLVRRTATQITIEIPITSEEIQIFSKKNEAIISTKYKIVI